MTSVFDLKDIRGAQRYYPPGQHPAMARVRAHLAKAGALMDSTINAPMPRVYPTTASVERATRIANLSNYILYLEDMLAAFEEVESECKFRDDWVLREGRGGR